MRKFLFIGKNTPGTTSAMRCWHLRKILHDWNSSVIDVDAPFFKQNKLFRSLAFRYNRGPVISAVNKDIIQRVGDEQYDLVWIDKGVFIKKSTLLFLRNHARQIVHNTPDTAFLYNRSQLFNDCMPYYDFLITTKSFELDIYYKHVNKNRVVLTTQGFDREVHRPYNRFSEKEGVILIGLCEPEREKIVGLLVKSGIKVKVAGQGWEKFRKKYSSFDNFVFLGPGLFGPAYGEAISASFFGLGLLSKRFPELHTTRTFEIPACKTALVTEDNEEIRGFYTNDEVVFYRNYNDLVERIEDLLQNKDELHSITEKGYQKVTHGGFDYESILNGIVKIILENPIK